MTLSRTPDGIAAALQELQERHVHTVPYDEL
jgi:hypothetical protein